MAEQYIFQTECYDDSGKYQNPSHRQPDVEVILEQPNELLARRKAIEIGIRGHKCPICGQPLQFTFDGNPLSVRKIQS